MTADPELVALGEVFETAHRLGFLGPGPAAEQTAHAVAFAAVVQTAGVDRARFLDLGSGGGIPGLVLAALWPDVTCTLLDSSQRRTAFLRRTVVALGWGSRVDVLEGRAEALGRDPGLRAAFPLVVSRSFAAPSVTAEIGGAFLTVGGCLAVSEPREAGTGDSGTDSDGPRRRWPGERLAELGLGLVETRVGDGVRVAVIRREQPVDDRWPRAVGIPAKRPLW